MSDAFDAALEHLALPDGARHRLATFARLVAAGNVRSNLTSASDPASLAEHIRDSLSLVPFVRAPLADVGSGGGFPAIPLVIVTGCAATLIESSAKKARFLQETVTTLELPIAVVARRAEEAARDALYRERFATATARAVGSVPTVLELTIPLLEAGGMALLQRGEFEQPEREASADAALMLGAELSEERTLSGSRRILLFAKRAPTPQRFPRRTGVPAKRPLCAGRG